MSSLKAMIANAIRRRLLACACTSGSKTLRKPASKAQPSADVVTSSALGSFSDHAGGRSPPSPPTPTATESTIASLSSDSLTEPMLIPPEAVVHESKAVAPNTTLSQLPTDWRIKASHAESSASALVAVTRGEEPAHAGAPIKYEEDSSCQSSAPLPASPEATSNPEDEAPAADEESGGRVIGPLHRSGECRVVDGNGKLRILRWQHPAPAPGKAAISSQGVAGRILSGSPPVPTGPAAALCTLAPPKICTSTCHTAPSSAPLKVALPSSPVSSCSLAPESPPQRVDAVRARRRKDRTQAVRSPPRWN